jgi:hypothetical protein
MSKATSAPKKSSVKVDNRPGIFKALKAILSKHIPPLMVLSNAADRFELITAKPFLHKGIRKDNAYFGAIMVKKDYVGLYLMFIYDDPANLDKLGIGLRKTLKGKSCFHIKKLDEILIKQIETALKDGIDYYKKEGAI